MRETSSRIVFRVAAGPRIGFGHLMRARALARALGVRPVVSVRGGATARRTAERIGCVVLPPDVSPFSMARLLVVDDPSAIQARAWVERARRQRVPCVGVQDAGAADCGADLVVDGGVCATPTGSQRRLEGSRYCLLDTRDAPKTPGSNRRPNRVLIALGGGAHVRRAARRLATAVAERCPSADIVVASGFVRTPLPKLPRGRWITRSSGLTSEFTTSSVAVVAGGQTMYEACSLGVPAVSVAVVGAQRRAIEACSAVGAIVDAGGPDMSPATAARVAGGVARLLASRQLRTRVSKRARDLVDGRGADRVARRITRLMRAWETAHV
ncbi:MAG: hypothetical protein HOP16_00170 [Acidobacteria bacterium]|nr:hypothetical protein [Acidobacteriota bacterium]